MTTQAPDPWPCSAGQGSGAATNCDVGCDSELLWPWRRLAAIALITPSLEPPYVMSAAPKRQKKKKPHTPPQMNEKHSNIQCQSSKNEEGVLGTGGISDII